MLTRIKHQFCKSSIVFCVASLCTAAVLFLVLICAPPASAAEYSIQKDEKGVYMQTDEHGSWYIGGADLKTFKVGDRGVYSIKKDKMGTFLVTDKPGKFYVDMGARAKIEQDIRETNIKYERDMEEFRKEQQKKEAQEKAIKAQKQAQERELQALSEAQERAIQADREAQQRAIEIERVKKRPIIVVPGHHH